MGSNACETKWRAVMAVDCFKYIYLHGVASGSGWRL